MSFKKEKITNFCPAEYWTITSTYLNFNELPEYVVDENNNVDLIGGSNSMIVLGLFTNYDAYLEGQTPLEVKQYSVPFSIAIAVIRSTQKTCEQSAYDFIESVDDFFSDAIKVD